MTHGGTGEEVERAIDDWDGHVATVVLDRSGPLATWGDPEHVVRIASISKLVTGHALLVAVEEGAIGLDDPAGPPGATAGDLFCHAGGLDFATDTVLAAPRTRRIYSNSGWEALVAHLERRSGIAWQDYLREAVTDPLGMAGTVAHGSPAKDLWAPAADLVRYVGELFAPTLVHSDTVAEAMRPRLADLAGVLPGVGSFRPNPWGLGFEVRGAKHPHWTGASNSRSTVGHFGGSGTFLWFDPVAGLAVVALGVREFGPWSLEVWPRLSDAILARFGAG